MNLVPNKGNELYEVEIAGEVVSMWIQEFCSGMAATVVYSNVLCLDKCMAISQAWKTGFIIDSVKAYYILSNIYNMFTGLTYTKL